MAEFQSPGRRSSAWQLINTLIPYGVLWYGAYRALEYSFWLALPIIALLAAFMVRTFIIFHDCGHRSFYTSKKTNVFWGILTGILTFTPFHYWRDAHARHHGTSANLDKRGEGDVWMMTLDEYMEAPLKLRIKYRLYRHPLVMFILGPLFITLLNNRIAGKGTSKTDRVSVYATDLALAVVTAGMIYLAGWKEFLLIQFTAIFLAHIAGVWLFYVQHQFEGVYWERQSGWDFVTASLDGGSFYKLPAILRWFTGSIGYHHLHHLNPRIPNYKLAKCHESIPVLQEIKPIGLFASLKSLKFRLWDEESRQLVGFSKVRQRRALLERTS